ncbi:aminotransferase class IV [Capnocytophaga sp. ARDL2]|uniref:aminotransferase class IV n=1 Tax=Capnocytophaga sp. ARDL2 TaxID=3238809 RepID=UPI0035578928
MVNFNGTIIDKTSISIEHNRAFLYGDGVFETIKSLDGQILFLEDHYFRLMASMRILRMEIPMDFTMEFLESEIQKTIDAQITKVASYRIRVTCFRNNGGKDLPTDRGIQFLITVAPLENILYELNNQPYEVEIFKDFHQPKHLISTLKTTNRLINITASVFAEENQYQNVLLINEDKNIVEAINGNIYLIVDNQIVTPPVADGCINGIMRKKLKAFCERIDEVQWVERSISPFELQKADELWISNAIAGIIPITKFRKKEYTNALAEQLINRLNAAVRLG